MTLGSEQLIDNSTFSKVLALYTRNSVYELLSHVSKNGYDIEKVWTKLVNQYKDSDEEMLKVPNNEDGHYLYKQYRVSKNLINVEASKEDVMYSHLKSSEQLLILEHHAPGEDQVRGLIMIDYTYPTGYVSDVAEIDLKNFHEWFSHLIVRDSRIGFSVYPESFDETKVLAGEIADFFAEHLKNTTINDLWDAEGRDFFIEKVHYFTSRNLQIESVLPAFPCKSSNTEKVHGLFPDKGEELALKRLIYLTKLVKRVYPAGLKVFIVSDGHVFSDCIGVDDDIVDEYTSNLKELYQKIIEDDTEVDDAIGFFSLKSIFFSERDKDIDEAKLVEQVELNHYTGSKICEDSELSRKLLMVGCDTDAGKLRMDIQESGHPRLHLYRGFSRFMTEDLSLHPFCKKLSRKAFKKTVGKVAFEMIKRNDAYSNLVELMFPFHLRLSIHAHTNSGPKFGIRLISNNDCRTIKALDSQEEPSFEDLLHIPTPWHNCVVKIDGHKMCYLTKSKIVQDAIEKGLYTGEWKKTDDITGIGGHYHLTRC